MPMTDMIRQLLKNRAIPEDSWEAFLSPNYVAGTHDPFLMKDMDKAVERILKAIENKENIVVYSDYDCDGIPGAVILHDFFKVINYDNFTVYIPDRHDEGYGLHRDAVESFIAQGTNLIITIDLGITAIPEIAYAQESGVDVIVTDHHIPHETLPPAFAILNPKQPGCDYPFKELCGSGVMFKLIQALMTKVSVPIGFDKWLLDMVGLATLSDMVPLVGENRVFAYYGMKVLPKTRRPGLRHLFKKTKLDVLHLTEDDLTFMITPRINVASRLDSPMRAFSMLSTTDEVLGIQEAEHLTKTNDTRKTLVATIMKKVHTRMEELSSSSIIIIGDPTWRPGVLGLVASKIVETYQKPAFVWGGEGDSYKGSCRSDGSVHVVDLMTKVSHLFDVFGGHEFSGGFSLPKSSLLVFHDELTSAYEKVKKEKELSSSYTIDAHLILTDITPKFYNEIAQLAPFGVGNPKPIFAFDNVRVMNIKHFGADGDHLEIMVSDGKVSKTAIAFFKKSSDYPKLELGEMCTLVATLEMSYFRGRPELRMRIVDVK